MKIRIHNINIDLDGSTIIEFENNVIRFELLNGRVIEVKIGEPFMKVINHGDKTIVKSHHQTIEITIPDFEMERLRKFLCGYILTESFSLTTWSVNPEKIAKDPYTPQLRNQPDETVKAPPLEEVIEL